jgi:hypothetical protein
MHLRNVKVSKNHFLFRCILGVTLIPFTYCPCPFLGLDNKSLPFFFLDHIAFDDYFWSLVIQLSLILWIIDSVPHYHGLFALSEQLRRYTFGEFLIKMACNRWKIIDGEDVLHWKRQVVVLKSQRKASRTFLNKVQVETFKSIFVEKRRRLRIS